MESVPTLSSRVCAEAMAIGIFETRPVARESRAPQKADKEIAMPTISFKSLIDLSNNLVWVVFVYLGYWAVAALVESFRRRPELRSAAREVREVRLKVNAVLCANAKDSGLTKKECMVQVLEVLRGLWGAISNVELASLLRSLCESIIAGRTEMAMDLEDRFLAARDGRSSTAIQMKDRCLQLGCFGTVLGIFGGFALSDGKTPPLSDLGFALGTTAVGIILAAMIELSLTTVFETAWCDLRDELEETRSHWSRLWSERTEMMPDDSDELLEIARVSSEVRELRRGFSELSSVLRDAFAKLPRQMAKELAAFTDSPVPAFDDGSSLTQLDDSYEP